VIRFSILPLCLLVGLAPVASAQDVRPSIEVVAAGDVATTRAMAERIRALERRFPVSVSWRERDAIDARDVLAPRSAEASTLARVWLDLTSPERALLFIANDANDRFLVRIVPTEDGYGELTQESLATIVDTAIDALLAGGQIGVDRSAAERTIASVEPQPPSAEPELVRGNDSASGNDSAARNDSAAGNDSAVRNHSQRGVHSARRDVLRSSFVLRYHGEVLDERGSMRHAPELALSLSGFFDPSFDLLVFVAAQYWAPHTLGEIDRNVALQGGGARAALGATGRVGELFVWQAAIGGGVDVLWVEPHVAPETGLMPAAPFALVSPMLTFFASAALRPAPWLEIAAGAGADADLAGNHFDVQIAGARDPVISPWPVRPFVFVGLGVLFDLGGRT
jgi:hypothetical protein